MLAPVRHQAAAYGVAPRGSSMLATAVAAGRCPGIASCLPRRPESGDGGKCPPVCWARADHAALARRAAVLVPVPSSLVMPPRAAVEMIYDGAGRMSVFSSGIMQNRRLHELSHTSPGLERPLAGPGRSSAPRSGALGDHAGALYGASRATVYRAIADLIHSASSARQDAEEEVANPLNPVEKSSEQ